MRSRWFHRPLLHSPSLGVEKRATWLELFYDLIFVAAFIQLGDGLSRHVSLLGAVIFAATFVPLWLAWTGFTFYENRLTVDDFLHRTLVLLQMFAVGGMAISAPAVFDGEFLVVWLYAHVPLQIAITATGVAIKKSVHFSWETPLPEKYRYLLAGSLALVYLAVGAIDSVTARAEAELGDRARINARASSGIFLLVLAPAGSTMSGGTFLAIVSAINVAQVVFDMMFSPLVRDAHAELGTRSTADLARAALELGERPPAPRFTEQPVRKGAPSDLRKDLYFYLRASHLQSAGPAANPEAPFGLARGLLS